MPVSLPRFSRYFGLAPIGVVTVAGGRLTFAHLSNGSGDGDLSRETVAIGLWCRRNIVG